MTQSLRYFFPLVFICLSSVCSLVAQNVESAYQDYLDERQELMRLDSQLYFDDGVILSDKENALNTKLLGLQTQMLSQYKDQHFFPPARNFYQSKEHIESTQLFEFIREMPKGGILHLHTGAIGDADWMIEKAKSLSEMYVFWEDNSLLNVVKGTLHAFKKEDVPQGFVNVNQLISDTPEAYNELRSLLVFEEEMNNDSIDIWNEFEKIFGRINGFIKYRPIYEDYLVHGLELLINDNIQHAELRGPFLDVLYDLDHQKGTLGIQSLANSLNNIKSRIKKIDQSFSFKIIHCGLRFKDKSTIWEEMETVFEHRKNYPDLIKGFDLVAEEDAGHSTFYHAKEFLKLDSLEKASGVELPLYLHDGESNWSSVSNLYDAVILDTKRIGHGFNLFRFPGLLNTVREKDICMEINPLSNQILGYLRDLRMHPASTYLRRGVNCTINSDDPLIFDYHGLSYDFWSVFLAWELDLASLKKLSQNSIVYSVLSRAEKKEALKIWKQRWDGFVDSMLETNLLEK